MIIDNGKQVHLVIDGVFDGVAGLSRGKVAFLPNQAGKRPEDANGGLMDGVAVRLTIARDGKGPLYASRIFAL